MKKNIIFLSLTVFSLTAFAQGNYQGKLGYGFSPEGHPYVYDSIVPFLQEVANTCNGGIVFANAAWRDSYATSGSIPSFQKTISLLQPFPYGYVDMINFGWATYPTLYLNVPGDTTNNWTNATAKNLFLQMLINAADSLQPTYFFIGNEVSIYWEQDSSDYLNWIAFYNQAYDSIKVHSPYSKVGTTFNYEHLTGNGTFVGFNAPHWNAFNVLDTGKIDILGLTVYPFFKYAHADSIPINYLDTIFSRMGNKPIAITETGWPGDSLIGQWYASPAEQVDYVNKIFSIITGKNVEVVNWLFLNYLMDTTNSAEMLLFKSVALRDSLGNDRPALPVWLSYCSCSLSTSILNATDCNNYFWNGNTYTVSGTYYDTIPNAAGCDSVMTLNLTINNSSTSSQTVTACNSYLWKGNTYTASGNYSDTIPNAAGCDSVMTLNLTINPSPVVSFTLNPDTVCYNTSAYSLSGGSPTGGSYSGNGVSGGNFNPVAVNPGVHIITYIYTNSNGCTDSATAQIVVEVCSGIASIIDKDISIIIFPNPSKGNFTLEQTMNNKQRTTIKIYNTLGEIVYQTTHNKRETTNEIDLSGQPCGIYSIAVTTGDKSYNRKLIIH